MTQESKIALTVILGLILVGFSIGSYVGYSRGKDAGYRLGVKYTAEMCNIECDEMIAGYQESCGRKYMEGLRACEYTQEQDCEVRIRVRENICKDDLKKAFALGKSSGEKSCTPKSCKVPHE